MSYTYAVLEAGRQGIAAAYDMARNGDAAAVLLADMDLAVAKAGAERINRLALLGEGRLQAVDSPVEVLTLDRLLQVYGVPVAATHHPLYGTPLVVPAIDREAEPDGP